MPVYVKNRWSLMHVFLVCCFPWYFPVKNVKFYLWILAVNLVFMGMIFPVCQFHGYFKFLLHLVSWHRVYLNFVEGVYVYVCGGCSHNSFCSRYFKILFSSFMYDIWLNSTCYTNLMNIHKITWENKDFKTFLNTSKVHRD